MEEYHQVTLSEWMELKEMLAEADPFDKDCNYLRISRYSKDSSMLGVALTFIRDFLNSI